MKPQDDVKPNEGQSSSTGGLCPACAGNDRDMPCAYPSEGMRGCFRDERRIFPLSLKERIRLAKEHTRQTGQKQDMLWPYQEFRMTLGELLEAAERGA